MKNRVVLILSALLMELVYILYRIVKVDPAQTVIKYMVVYGVGFVLLAAAFFLLKHQEFSRFFFLSVLLFSFVFGMTLVTAPPGQSDDIYRYIWDGKLQYFGVSPYTYAPADPALEKYHSEILPKLVNWPEIKTIYPPVAQLFFRVSYTLFGESVGGMKFLFLLVTLGSIRFFYLTLKGRGGDPRLLLFFAWNPLLIMETAVNGHLDILMVFFLLMCLRFFYKNKFMLSGIALASAILCKLIPVVLVPVFFFYFTTKDAKDTKEKKGFRFFIPLLGTIIVFYALYFKSAQNMFLTAVNYSTKWYFNNPLFHGILAIFKDNAIAHMVSFSLFIAVYLVILITPAPLERKIVYAMGAFVLCNPTIHPWYLIVLIGFLCIYSSGMIMLWSGLVVVGYIVVYRFKLTGTWQDSWVSMGIEYLPLGIFLMKSFWTHLFSKRWAAGGN